MAVRRISWNAGEASGKLTRLKELCEEAKEDGRRVLVFSYFLDTLEICESALGADCVGRIDGGLSPLKRQELVDRFKEASDGAVLLGQVTAELLYRWEPSLPEGKMTRIRAELVCEESLHRVATDLGLGQWMRLGKGEERSSGRERPSILADMVEAVIAAVYLDGGMEPAVRLIHEKVLSHARDTIQNRNR
ncbi:MAG: hypothetical protein IKO11_02000, partial [Lachnospiraceae bacterium]|nr:hypothetical protein [Lachnospiraceae bacterium]